MGDESWPTFGRPPQGGADSWELEGELRQLTAAELRRCVHLLVAERDRLLADVERLTAQRAGDVPRE